MFNPIEEVPSLGLCRMLKRMEFPQDTGGWYWVKTNIGWILGYLLEPVNRYPNDYHFFFPITQEICFINKNTPLYKAPTLREVLEWLPTEIKYKDTTLYLELERPDETQFLVSYCYDLFGERICPLTFGDDNIINAPIKMLIYLTHNGYISFKQKEG